MKAVYFLCGVAVVITVGVIIWAVALNPRESREWKAAETQDSIPAYEEFIRNHGQSQYTPLASNKLARLHEANAWLQVSTNPSVVALRSFQREFPSSPHVLESLTMLTNLFHKQWNSIKTSFDGRLYSEFVGTQPPQELESEARLMLRVLEKAREYRVGKLQTLVLKSTDVSISNSNITFHCTGPLDLGPLSLPDRIPMRIECPPEIVMREDFAASEPATVLLCWGLGGLPKVSHMETMGIFYSGRQHPNAITFSDTNKSVLLSLKIETNNWNFTFNDGRNSDEFFTPVALLTPKKP